MKFKKLIRKKVFIIAIAISIILHLIFLFFFLQTKFKSGTFYWPRNDKKVETKVIFLPDENLKNETKLAENKLPPKKETPQTAPSLPQEAQKQKEIPPLKSDPKEKKYKLDIMFTPNGEVVKGSTLEIAHKKNDTPNKESEKETFVENEDLKEEITPKQIEEKYSSTKEAKLKEKKINPSKLEFENLSENGNIPASKPSKIKKETIPQDQETKESEVSETKDDHEIKLKQMALSNLFKSKSIPNKTSKTEKPKLFYDENDFVAENEKTVLPLPKDSKKQIIKLNRFNGIGNITQDGDEDAPWEVIQEKIRYMNYLNKVANSMMHSIRIECRNLNITHILSKPTSVQITFNDKGELEDSQKVESCGNENIDKTFYKAIKHTFPVLKVPADLKLKKLCYLIEYDFFNFSIYALSLEKA